MGNRGMRDVRDGDVRDGGWGTGDVRDGGMGKWGM